MIILLINIFRRLGWTTCLLWALSLLDKHEFDPFVSSIKVTKHGMNYKITMRKSESKSFNKYANKLGFGFAFFIRSEYRGTL